MCFFVQICFGTIVGFNSKIRIIMKTPLFLFMIFFSSLLAFSMPHGSELEIQSVDRVGFAVVVDGLGYWDLLPAYCLTGLRPGHAWVEIYRAYVNRYGQMQYVLVARTRIFLKNKHRTIMDLLPDGRLITRMIVPIYDAAPVYTHNPYAVNFIDLKHVIASQNFDNTRLEIAKVAISQGYFTSAQIYEIMTLLTFESNRLELAKFAYQYVTDPENYYLVTRAFTFSSSADELMRFIRPY